MKSSAIRHGPGKLWRWPATLAILTTFGLLSALLGQGGLWWVLSWIALAIPLVVAVVCFQRQQRPVVAAMKITQTLNGSGP
jgi:hypothetical protein